MSAVDFSDPVVKAAIRRRVEAIVADRQAAIEEEAEEFMADMVAIRDALETARRHLTSPQPKPSEAMIYIERALAVTARTQ